MNPNTFADGRRYRVAFSRPIGLAPGRMVPPGIIETLFGEEIRPFAELVTFWEAADGLSA